LRLDAVRFHRRNGLFKRQHQDFRRLRDRYSEAVAYWSHCLQHSLDSVSPWSISLVTETSDPPPYRDPKPTRPKLCRQRCEAIRWHQIRSRHRCGIIAITDYDNNRETSNLEIGDPDQEVDIRSSNDYADRDIQFRLLYNYGIYGDWMGVLSNMHSRWYVKHAFANSEVLTMNLPVMASTCVIHWLTTSPKDTQKQLRT